MKTILDYLNFLREKGISLSERTFGNDEFALNISDALRALDILYESQIVILGGDILSEKGNGEFIYAYQLLGDGQEYHYLNWYCDKQEDESQEEYAKRSYIVAKEGIKIANIVAERLEKKCYIVIVI